MNTEAARIQMINQQVRAWDVLDATVLQVLGEVAREDFVPPALRALAFADTAIPLPHGQCMMTPQVEGRLLQALAVRPAEQVLEIGTGSGFLAACLARLGGHVTSLEIFPDLADGARRALAAAGAGKVEVVTADVYAWQPAESYDCIAITGSLPVYDPRFAAWLKPGGRLFVIVGEAPVMDARLVRGGADGSFISESLFETVITPLINAVQPEKFVF
jgi:protein-L-isoaspartate(D-aspartate) O-methyltransferase